MPHKPWVAVPADSKLIGPHPFQSVGEKYLRALHDVGGLQPVIWPTLFGNDWIGAALDRVDGLFLTGSHSNIEPHRFAAAVIDPGFLHDPQRDATTLPLIPEALRRGVPILAVCRGLQEVNVAFGGSLLQKIHETPGFNDHREDLSQSLDLQYAPAHAVDIVPGGYLAGIAAGPREQVNSLHGQGIDRLGEGLRIEARAEDGLIEAVSLADSSGWLLAVQWHPEWKAGDNRFYRAIFQSFADACRARARTRS